MTTTKTATMEQSPAALGIGKRVLVAEDEKPIAHALELKLKNSGFQPTVVYDGEAALQLLEKEKFDIVLLDLIMPKIDGFSVLEELHKRGDKTLVIVSSNLSQEEDFKRAKDLGAVDYFIKSNTPIQKVVELVQKALGSSSK